VYRWTLLRGAPRLGPAQGASGYIVFGVDIEDRRRGEARRTAALAATRIFAESVQTDTAVPRLLAAVAQGLEYDSAELWLVEPATDTLRLSHRWPALRFVADTEAGSVPAATCRRSEGLPGAVWESQAMTLVSQANQKPDRWAPGAACAVGVPVLGGGAAFQGVLVFRAGSCHRLHEELEFLAELASRLAQFMDHRMVEAASREAEVLRSAILDSLPANVALLDGAGRVLAINEAWKRFAAANGWTGALHGVPLNYLEVCDAATGPGAEDAQAAALGIRAVLAGTSERFELRYPCHSPTEQRWFRMIVVPLPQSVGSGAVVMHLDLTTGVLAEQALSASETRYRLLARATTDVIYEWDIQTDRWIWNEGLGRVLGYQNPEFQGTWWHDLIHSDDRERIVSSLEETLAGSAEVWTGLYRFRRADDSYCFVANRGYIVRDDRGRAVRMIGAISDITLRKQAEHQIQRSEAALAAAQKVARVGSWELDMRDGSTVWSAEMYRILGLEQRTGPVAASLLLDLVHPEDRALLTACLRDAIRAGVSFDLEFRIIRPDRTVRHVHARTQVTRNAAGTPEYAIGAIQDVTEQRENERKLVQREHRLRLLNSIATGIRAPMTVAQVSRHVVRQLYEYFPDCRVTYSRIDADLRLQVLECANPATMADLTGAVADLSRAPRYLAALRQRGPIVVLQPDSNPELASALRGVALGAATLLVMPLLVSGQLIGMLTLASADDRSWGAHEMDVLREVGDALTVAIGEARAQEERARAVEALELSRAQLRDLARQLQVAREKERTRIAREIHDVLGQALTALHMETALLLQHRFADRSGGDKLLSRIDGMLDSVQRLAAGLRPSVLDDLGLTAAILWEVGELQARTGVNCECHLPETVGVLTAEQSTTIFRILQEALTNVARHSKADAVRIRLEVQDVSARLTISDNGAGIPEEAMSNPRSLGIVGMRERALALNGRLTIESRFGAGTSLVLDLPLDGAADTRTLA
jgi:PAS domain S-box-containing protein